MAGDDKPGRPDPPPIDAPVADEDSLVFDWLPVDKNKAAGAAAPPAPPAQEPPPAPSPRAQAAPPPQPEPPSDPIPAAPPHRIVPLPPPKPAAASKPFDSDAPEISIADRLIYPPGYNKPQAKAPPTRVTTPPPSAPAPRPAPVPAPKAVRKAAGRSARPVSLPVPALAAAGLLLAGVAGYFWLRPSPPKVASVSPVRARPGQTVTLRGENFGAQAQDNEVRFETSKGRVLRATTGELEVEVPADVPTRPGQDTPVSVVVTRGGRASAPLKLQVAQAPVIRALAPDVALPGDEIVVNGGGWGDKAQVSIGSATAEVLEAKPESLRVKVPELPAAAGASVPVVVAAGSEQSVPATLLVGRLPLLTSVEPKSCQPGDLLTLKGRGFAARPADNAVLVGGERALVVSAAEGELKVVAPLPQSGAAGAAAVEVRVPGSSSAGTGTLALAAPRDAVAFRFVAIPLADKADHDHAVLATELGPAFVISASGGRSAAQRASEAQRRLNDSAGLLAAPEAASDLELRDASGVVAIGLRGREPLLEATDQDAAAYDESGGSFRGNAGKRVTKGRLAVWWLALTRDLAALLASGERPRHVALLTPEGRLFADLHDARRQGGPGIPRAALSELRPETRKGLLALAMRVPPAASEGGQAQVAASAGAAEDPLQLEGQWSGTSTEGGVTRPVRAVFTKNGGTLTFLKPLEFSVALGELERPRMGSVRFSARVGSGKRYFQGSWDGESLSGTFSATADGKATLGRFELRR
jgi:hypothetical protein